MRIPIRASLLIAFASVGALACHDDPVAPHVASESVSESVPPTLVTAPGHDLDLTFVPLHASADSGPSSAPINAAPPAMPVGYGITRAWIRSARSYPFAAGGIAGNQAITVFTGNRIRVDSWATVSFLGSTIVSDFKQRTEDTYFFPQMEKTHSAYSVVSIDADCGHSATGRAEHEAWTSYAPFGWGPTVRSSTGERVSQPDCITEVTEDEAGWSWPGFPSVNSVCSITPAVRRCRS